MTFLKASKSKQIHNSRWQGNDKYFKIQGYGILYESSYAFMTLFINSIGNVVLLCMDHEHLEPRTIVNVTLWRS